MNLNPKILYKILIKKFGYQNWWPIDTDYHIKNNSDPRFEIIVGAILTQNTAWSNVEKSLLELKKAKLLDLKKILDIQMENLQIMVKPSGFFRQKSKRLINLSLFLKEKYNGDLDVFFEGKLNMIRNELLSLNGIGPETADSILLYAGNKPIFVVDKYTKRICNRLPLEVEIDYLKIQNYFENNLIKNLSNKNLIYVYKEYHALIVELCKKNCKKQPKCENCVIRKYCNFKEYYINKL